MRNTDTEPWLGSVDLLLGLLFVLLALDLYLVYSLL